MNFVLRRHYIFHYNEDSPFKKHEISHILLCNYCKMLHVKKITLNSATLISPTPLWENNKGTATLSLEMRRGHSHLKM